MDKLKVVPLPPAAETGVSASLRAIARAIDRGELNATGGVILLERAGGAVDAYGMGDCSDVVRGIGLLHVASFALTRGHDAEVRARGGEPAP